MKHVISALILLFTINTTMAAVEVTYKHDLFKELHSYIIENSSYIGIGWEVVDAPEEKYKLEIADLEQQGYRWSRFPYKIELILFITFVLLSGFAGSRYSKMQQYRRGHE